MEKHNHHTANSRVRLRHVCALCVCVFAALALVTITGCRDTDALREIIIDQNSDVIDYNNEQKFYINDSTAEEESDLVSSLEVSDEDPESDIIQNLIIYSSEPNSEGFTAKHSAFSDTPDFTGIEASDTVFFYYSDALDAFPHALTPVPDVEEENDEQEEEVIVIPYATTLANGNTASTGAAGGTAGLQETTSAESASEGTTGEDSTDDAEDETPGDDAGDAGTPEDESTDQGGGLGEEVIQPDDSHPGEQFPTENATINTVKSPDEWSNTTNAAFNRDEDYDQYDCVAAFGEYAKIVQMVGGDGALAATDAETLSTLQSWGVSVSADVGWDYASGAVLNADGTWAIDVEAIVASGAQAILLGTTFESYTYSMSDDQLNYLEENNVALVPSENLYTSVNIKTNVNAVGYMLQGSSLAEYGSQAESRASEYCDRHDDMVNVNGGLAQDDDYYTEGTNGRPELQDASNTLGWSNNSTTHTVLISFWDNTARMTLSGFDFGPGAAYANAGYSTTPVSFYMQAGGTINTAASRTGLNATGMVPVLQFTGEDGSKNESSWYDTQLAGNINYNKGNGYHALLDSGVDGGGSTRLGKGFGSDSFPKIIVTSSYYKDAIVENSASESSLYHPWKFTGSGISSMALGVPNSILWTSIGSNLESGTVDDPNPVYPEGYIYPEDILVNPSGICDWTQGTVESFLETGFVAAYINGSTTGYSREDWHADVTSFYEWAWGITPNISSIDTNGAECVN